MLGAMYTLDSPSACVPREVTILPYGFALRNKGGRPVGT